MKKNNITGKYVIDEKLNIIEIEENESSIELTYEVKGRDGENLEVLVTITDNANGLQQVEYLKDGHIEQCNGKKSVSRDCIIQLGEEYKVQITSKSGEEKTETILINDYYHTITKNLGEGISIDNSAIKAAYNKPYKATIIADDEYIIDTIAVTMGGQKIEVDKSTGVINIEKVTGDIEITATARKLEIHMTDPIIGTSTTSTSSVADNSQIRGTTLYINFSATLEDQNCTITYKEDETKTVPFAITKNGKYVFIVKGIYSGKTIEEEKEVEVNKYKSPSGIVQYDAGEWTQEEIEELKSKNLYNINIAKTASAEKGLDYTFGGFTYLGDTTNAAAINNGTIITSRNQSVSPQSSYGSPAYDGWQVLELKDSNGNIITKEEEITSKLDTLDENEKIYVTKLVHCGSPENFVHYYDDITWSSHRAEYILSSGTREQSHNTYNPRNWDMYIDDQQSELVNEVHAMTYEEAFAVYPIKESTNYTRRNIGALYWLANYYDYNCLWTVRVDGWLFGSSMAYYNFGIRPVISLNDGVYIKKGDGTEADPYILGKD